MNPQPKTKPIRLKGKAKTEFRRAVAERAKYHCEDCGCHAPSLVYGVFDVFNCGHVAHIKSYGAGGGDTMDNVKWKCNHCHIEKEHGPRWSHKCTILTPTTMVVRPIKEHR